MRGKNEKIEPMFVSLNARFDGMFSLFFETSEFNSPLTKGLEKLIMKRLLITLLLSGMGTPALAEWNKVGESEGKGGFIAYADLASKRKVGDRAKMWVLFDYEKVQKASGAEFLSEKIRREYDCKEKQMRKLAFSLFSWNMEGGELVRSYSQPQKWEPVPAGSIDEAEWETACH
ncbi:MAG TPA: surface-adhesin E family protein [Nitrosomonas sp.]|nr:surface-adhesin E family protein [Nitrosomonas sp.]